MLNSVYVVNYGGYNYDGAEQYGDLVFITKGFVDLSNETAFKKAQERLQKFIEDATPDDYLLLSGNSLLCAIAVVLWRDIHKKVKILHWDTLQKGYVLYNI